MKECCCGYPCMLKLKQQPTSEYNNFIRVKACPSDWATVIYKNVYSHIGFAVLVIATE